MLERSSVRYEIKKEPIIMIEDCSIVKNTLFILTTARSI